jgi:hypothetical protein
MMNVETFGSIVCASTVIDKPSKPGNEQLTDGWVSDPVSAASPANASRAVAGPVAGGPAVVLVVLEELEVDDDGPATVVGDELDPPPHAATAAAPSTTSAAHLVDRRRRRLIRKGGILSRGRTRRRSRVRA